jgi:DNA-directed RNA polymerase subunit K/omega
VGNLINMLLTFIPIFIFNLSKIKIDNFIYYKNINILYNTMPSKKKLPIEDKDDDKTSVSTDSDIESGTFSQYDENADQIPEINDSETESVDSETVDDIIEDNDDLAEDEEVLEEVEDIKPKKKKGIKKTVVINNECLYNNIDFEEDYDEKIELVPDNKRITINRLTKYEKVRIIGIRAKQIITGANILLKGIENKTPIEIAELELKHNMIPFKIKRRLPNDRYEIWKLSELEK